MNNEQILMCVVALVLGMLLANMLKSVCGCKVVEGQCTWTTLGMAGEHCHDCIEQHSAGCEVGDDECLHNAYRECNLSLGGDGACFTNETYVSEADGKERYLMMGHSRKCPALTSSGPAKCLEEGCRWVDQLGESGGRL